MPSNRWQFWIDRGGTFTDCIGIDPVTGAMCIVKVLSSDAAPLHAIRRVLGLEPNADLPLCDVRMGTTLATNALLERRGARCVLVTTRGFGDLLEIGDQARPHLFELAIRKREILPEAILETDARGLPDGGVLAEPDLERLEPDLVRVATSGVRSAAVVLMFSHVNGQLEREVGDACRRAGFDHIALSHELNPDLGLLGRADTAVLDAYLTPLLTNYVAGLAAALGGGSLAVMQSSGRLASASLLRGPAAILSGPAGGVVAVAAVAKRAGLDAVIGFDMGGTSTDVCRYAGRFERSYETEIAAVRLRTPVLRVHTVAAGGGSVCQFDGRRFHVGPQSAGAEPGPLCYGSPSAKEITITDANVLLGRLPDDRFPFPLDAARVERAFAALAARVRASGRSMTPEQIAEGFVQIADSSMADAIRRVSVSKGHDVRKHALVVFGGAGGQHACAVARALGIEMVIVSALAGVFSAYGIGQSQIGWNGEAHAGQVELSPAALAQALPVFERLEREGRQKLASERAPDPELVITRHVALRHRGTQSSIDVELGPIERMIETFHAEHQARFGYARREHPIELGQLRLELTVPTPAPTPLSGSITTRDPPPPLRRARIWSAGAWRNDCPVYPRDALEPGVSLAGPALVLDATSTLVVDVGFRLTVSATDLIALQATEDANPVTPALDAERPDPVLLEIMANHFMSIAEQMGEALRRTAVSTNIRERLDFSCAVFDADGGLCANAPHIPVHLGAMSESVRAVMANHPHLSAGSAFVTNDPAHGGSHLPDITVVTPVHHADGRLIFFTASRGHHAEIGGTTPGSMPAFSRSLEEEGVVLSSLPIVRGGRFDRDALTRVLAEARYPSRRPDDNLADIDAQLAANQLGAQLLARLVTERGLARVQRYMQHVQDDAHAKVAEEIERLADGEYRFDDALDSGTRIAVCVTVRGRTMRIDFTGTDPETDDNSNAPRAVTLAAVLYVLRSLVGAPIPLNSGCLRPVELVIPARSVLDPSPGRAVAGGNVETSQRVVDVLLGALGRAAASQGTMNNVTFGNDHFGYYETIAGGAGAGPGFAGASAVHTHMTNTRITDAEVLEARYPIRVVRFGLRRGSGGRGRWSGGDGVTREYEMLAPVHVSILSERRRFHPFGLEGGEPGRTGINAVDGVSVDGKVSVSLALGQRLSIETPGGGGFGAAR